MANIDFSEYGEFIRGKNILITGGTGSFGGTFARYLLKLQPKRIAIFSRGEKKQFDMRNEYNDDRLEFVIGDVRDKESIGMAMEGIDFVFHAAALKQVPACEFFPMEAIKTNVLGGANVVDAAIKHNVQKVVVLSTDKAVYPINAMGISKALMEKIMISRARDVRNKTVLCGVRYGNVMCSRGSVLPLFADLIRQGKPLTITNKDMTRFLLSLDDSVDLVFLALVKGKEGSIFVKKAPAATIEILANAMISIFSAKSGVKDVGIREGEKMHETLVTREEMARSIDHGGYFEILPEFRGLDYDKYFVEGDRDAKIYQEGYTSANTERLSLEKTIELVGSLEEVRQALKLSTR